ncbi:MAG: elongation factor G [Clostridia bacterium]|nr:elongation factor G [Clostridia bacterium]
MAFALDKIRNVCLLGHGGDGKTSLVESMLYMTQETDRLGNIADGNTISDFDPEEIKRQFSIQLSLSPIRFKDHIINLIDTPGYFDFEGEVMSGLRAADAGIIVVSAKNGCAVGTEKAWKEVRKRNLPAFFYISKVDEDQADYEAAYASLRQAFGNSVTPFVIPLFDANGKSEGVINLLQQIVYKAENGKINEYPVPANKQEKVDRLRGALIETVAMSSDELMEKYFDGEEFTMEEILEGLRKGVIAGDISPVICGSAYTGLGTMDMIRAIINYGPAPNEIRVERGVDEEGNALEMRYDANGDTAIFVFKTVADQYGRFSYFKVMQGELTPDMTLINSQTGAAEKMGHIYIVKGKKQYEVDKIGCGDIGAVSKLTNTRTGDTLTKSGTGAKLRGVAYSEPAYSRAISPKVKGGEEKMVSGLNRLRDEDPSFTLVNNAETKQMVISGAGDMHLDVLCSKLQSKFGVEVELGEPKVAYREKIRAKVSVEGKHKKQSGGHGQYGHVKMDFEPIYDSDEEFIFAETIFGGSVPRNFWPAVEKGVREAMEHGVLAGYPMVGLKATLTDGSYHDVDSNELSFKMAARLAYKAGIPNAKPVILEPVNSIKINIPDSYMGDVIGDMNKRRGRIMGMNPAEDGTQIVEAEVPAAEITDYAITLRSMTQGRGSFTTKFERYEEVPVMTQEKIIAEAAYHDDEE